MKNRLFAVVMAFMILSAGGVGFVSGRLTQLDTRITANASVVDSGVCGENLKWVLDDEGTLTISGTGEMDLSPWSNQKDSIKNVFINEGVTSIWYSAFYGCKNITSITIPDSVTSIGNSAFSNCTSLADITIPDSVTSIGYNVFYDTPWLEAKRQENPLVIVNNILIDGCTCSGDVIIPDGVTSIEENAFIGDVDLTSIKIPDSVKSIGSYAFQMCINLKEIIIPDSVTEIGIDTFAYCKSLKSVVIGKGITKLPDYKYTGEGGFFHNCTNLESVTLHDDIEYIGEYTFSNCSSLKEIVFPANLSHVGSGAFLNTPWFDNQPDGVVYAGNVVYTYKGDMPENTEIVLKDGTTGIAADAFYNCKNLSSIILPDGLKDIGYGAFWNCVNLKSLIIPDSVVNFQYYVFYGCSSLTELKLSENISYLSSGVNGSFAGIAEGCDKLTSITIPAGVKDIYDYSLSGNANLESVIIMNPKCRIYENAFYSPYVDGINLNATIYGYADSTAQEYAENHNYKFIALEGEPPVTIPEKEYDGDFNGDGFIDALDASLILGYYSDVSTGRDITFTDYINENCN